MRCSSIFTRGAVVVVGNDLVRERSHGVFNLGVILANQPLGGIDRAPGVGGKHAPGHLADQNLAVLIDVDD
jgi:hypothetical protein